MSKPLHFHCPGRVNLIGEHIDYNGGLVMPFCISRGISLVFTSADDGMIRLSSKGFESFELSVSEVGDQTASGKWSDFPIGVMKLLGEKGMEIPAGSYSFESDLPTGSGLSSSAAIEVLTYYTAYLIATGNEPDRVQMALECQKVENEFVGVNCGIMDQFAVANGRAGHAMKLDCSTLKMEQVPVLRDDFSWLIIDSKKPRTLAGSAYNQRKAECEEALQILQQKHEVENLCSAELAWLDEIENEVLRKRFRHCVTEQNRVEDCARFMASGQLEQVGRLLIESHRSLQYDYEVSCEELDFIVDELNSMDGVLGARMTGAGFGGCCVALISQARSETIQALLKKSYLERFRIELESFVTTPNDGVRQMHAL